MRSNTMESKTITVKLDIAAEENKQRQNGNSIVNGKMIEEYFKNEANLQSTSVGRTTYICKPLATGTKDPLRVLTIDPKDVIGYGKIKEVNQAEVVFEFKIIDKTMTEIVERNGVTLDRIVINPNVSIVNAVVIPRI